MPSNAAVGQAKERGLSGPKAARLSGNSLLKGKKNQLDTPRSSFGRPYAPVIQALGRRYNRSDDIRVVCGKHSPTAGAPSECKIVMALQVSTRESADVTILDLRGRATIGRESESLKSRLRELVAAGRHKLLLNLANLTQADSSGISVIVATHVSLKRQGGDLKLLRPCGRVLEVLTVCRLLDAIGSFEDEAEALASFRPRRYSATS